MKENKTENLVWIIFAGIGGVFFIIGIFIMVGIFSNYANAVDTKGTITEIRSYGSSDDRSHDVYVSYVVDGKEYVSELNAYSSTYYKGKEIKIYYDKNNPNKIGVKSMDLIFLIFPGIGLIFLIIGGSGIIININKKKAEKKLRETGQLIYADYSETTLNGSYQVNGRPPYNIICEWNDPVSNQKYIFRSKNLWLNPDKLIQEKNIRQFPVYIDRSNMKKYVVDTDILTNNIIDLR